MRMAQQATPQRSPEGRKTYCTNSSRQTRRSAWCFFLASLTRSGIFSAEKLLNERTQREQTKEESTMSRLRRSLLFVPASSEKFFAKAKDSPADTLIFDLEDAVAPDRKPAAREALKEVLRDQGFARFERTVRINGLDTPYFLDDVLAMVETGADGLVVPKTNTAESILFVDRLVTLAEQRCGRTAGSVALLPLIEQPEAIGNAFTIARATPRVAGIAFGHGDFSLAMGI